MTFFASHNGSSLGKGSGSVTSSAAPAKVPSFRASVRATWSRMAPRAMLMMKAPLDPTLRVPASVLVLPGAGAARSANSSLPNEWRVAGVSGRAMMRASKPERRKVWREALSLPLYQAVGIVPSGSPVPGTQYPSSLRDSGVGRGLAVYAWMEAPRAEKTRAAGVEQAESQKGMDRKTDV